MKFQTSEKLMNHLWFNRLDRDGRLYMLFSKHMATKSAKRAEPPAIRIVFLLSILDMDG